ncbi:MAG: hypothetical protein NT150_12885 [Bacteroidetes bacterium]|nr:hypothetical protein [Bacteroidota bacterium]
MNQTLFKQLIFLLCCFLCAQAIAQNIKLEEEYYSSGQLERKGYQRCDSMQWEGRIVLAFRPIGLWQYWYENGKLEVELFYDLNGKTKYVNLWLPKGEQVLQSGNGYYHEIEYGGNKYNDSLIFQIKDSLKTGPFLRYSADKTGHYKIVERGFYNQNLMSGLWNFKDSLVNVSYETNYIEGKETGLYTSYYFSGKIKESGQKIDGGREGIWKFFDENGALKKEISYKHYKAYGSYIEYYPSGEIKIKGQYGHTNGYDTMFDCDADGNMKKRKVANNNTPVKSGEWTFYNKRGKLIRKKLYSNYMAPE